MSGSGPADGTTAIPAGGHGGCADGPTGPWSAGALRVLEARYLRRDVAGRVIETPDELLLRVARAVAHAELLLGTAREAERWEARFHELLTALDFLPNSPALMNAGTPLGQLAACFVLPVADSMEGIFGALRAMALVQRSGGGAGFSFSPLRPRGEAVSSTGGEASGPVSFMRIFDCATESIKAGGRRRGANMAVLHVDHPDILEFVEAKRDGRSFANFNLSVGVTDGFMRAVERGEGYALRRPVTGRPTRRVQARDVFDRIVAAAWETGDPGLLFLDAIDRANPLAALGRIEATNPCGEVPLLPYESCVLGSVNLANMVPAESDVDWERLRQAVRVGVRFLDDVIEVNREPLPEIAEATRASRKIGLGVMGFAECLIRLGVSYDSEAAIAWADRLMAFVAAEARAASRELAEQRGVFPSWPRSVFAETGERLRNATRLSMAPTGTIAIIAGTSSGIEPLFALAYRRAHTLGGPPLAEVNPIVLRRIRARGSPLEPLLEELLAGGRLGTASGAPEALRRLFVTALEIPPKQHLLVQQAFQRHVDNAVSKTINLAEDAGADAVAEVYREAWRLGLKGITVYRYGSRAPQVLTLGAEEEPTARELFTKCDPGACRL
jgi:ribonucleoside-diphosphate reductase alpha chain